MAQTFGMPQWGITMEEGTVTEWVAKVGQHVREGDVLAVISTDKIDTEFESPITGVVAAHLAAEGDTLACGEDLVVIAEGDEDLQAWKASQ
jgi:pyruvate/2-oxoglutarate dehydrogenase complex dihydrolipoamide acyltransferase (E2) component